MTIAAILAGKGDDVFQVGPDASVLSVVQLLAERRIGCVPVVEDGEVIGIFSERDIIYGLGKDGASVLDLPVRSVMTSPAMTITPDVAAISALGLMTKRRVRHLPVIDNGRMIGFVSIGDLVKYRVDQVESEAAALRDYIQSA